jgi:3-(3-hydroxy-phenyl)propionate hydroxylase
MINTGRLSAPCAYGESALMRGGHPSAGAALPNVLLCHGGEGAPSAETLHGLLGPWFTALVMTDRLPDRRAGHDHPLLTWVAVAAHCDDEGRQRLARQLGVEPDDGSIWLIRPDQHVMAVGTAEQAVDTAAWLRQALASDAEESSVHAHRPALTAAA